MKAINVRSTCRFRQSKWRRAASKTRRTFGEKHQRKNSGIPWTVCSRTKSPSAAISARRERIASLGAGFNFTRPYNQPAGCTSIPVPLRPLAAAAKMLVPRPAKGSKTHVLSLGRIPLGTWHSRALTQPNVLICQLACPLLFF